MSLNQKQSSSKVGVLTLHYGYNEGAVLQAYCLTKLLNQTGSLNSEVIDLRYPKKSEVYGPATDSRKKAIADSASCWLPCSKQQWNAIPGAPFYQHLERDYSAIVVGSDVVWSLKYTRRLRSIVPGGILPQQNEPFHPKFPNAYWLPQKLKIPKFSYAASLGSFDWSLAPRRHLHSMKSCLEDFAAISVRDEKTLEFVRHLDPGLAARTQITPDPTLCVDLKEINPDEASVYSKLIAWGLGAEQKKVGFLLNSQNKYQPLARFFEERNWQSASLTTPNSFSNNHFYDKALPPQEWARALGFFDFVITERMHGMIFCLKNKVPFLATDINPNSPDKPSKVVSLLERFDLMDCYCHKDSTQEELITTLHHSFNKTWDWDRIHKVIESLKTEGRQVVSNIENSIDF